MNGNQSIYYRKEDAYQRQQDILAGKAFRRSKYLPSHVWKGSERTIALIRGFQEHLFSKGTGQYRIAKVTSALRVLCDHLEKDLDQVTKADAVTLIAYINTNPGWGEHSKSDYRRVIKQFYLWFEDEDARLQADDLRVRTETQRLYKYLREVSGKAKRQQKDPADMITEEDCMRLLYRGAKSTMQQALVATLHATGVRVGELLSQRIGDLHERSTGMWVHVNGKTGRRPVPLGFATPYITKWVNEHPDNKNKNAPLWVSIEPKDYGKPLRYIGVARLLRRVSERAGLQKPCNPHNFRHSRETIWAQKFTEAEQCILMGWEPGSRQPSNYTHLTPEKVEQKYGAVHGLVHDELAKPEIIKCQICSEINSRGAHFCLRCGRPLSMEILLRQQAAIDEADKELINIMSNPDRLQRFQDILRAMRNDKP